MVRFIDSGDESDTEIGGGLAPVTPLFGERTSASFPKTADDVRRVLDDRVPEHRAQLASSPARRTTAGPATEDDPPGGDPAEGDAAEAAERGLLKKLRARQLSVSEAKTYLGQHELDAGSVEVILDAFLGRGYLDDARLAEQVVHSGVDRKGQGRRVIAQNLAKRGVPRDVADAALEELPDDDAERALEFARTKAGSMRGLERDVALRRLAGQLARRGYGGSIALDAARTALDETARPSGRVRFD
jgi:regulatory protein